jgi:lysyl-tRNA synthetase class II
MHLRRFFWRAGFWEIDTPVFEPLRREHRVRVYGHWSRRIRTSWGLASEEYLKRLLAGGMDRVFEIRHRFRPDPVTHTHHPEFCVLEAYWAPASLRDGVELVRRALKGVVGLEAPAIETGPRIEVRWKGLEIAEVSAIDPFAFSPSPLFWVGRRFPRPGPTDPELLHALDVGLPPGVGVAIGIDRVLMGLLDCSIHEAAVFGWRSRSSRKAHGSSRS